MLPSAMRLFTLLRDAVLRALRHAALYALRATTPRIDARERRCMMRAPYRVYAERVCRCACHAAQAHAAKSLMMFYAAECRAASAAMPLPPRCARAHAREAAALRFICMPCYEKTCEFDDATIRAMRASVAAFRVAARCCKDTRHAPPAALPRLHAATLMPPPAA